MKKGNERKKKLRVRPDGITGRESLCTIRGLEHPRRRPWIFDLIANLDKKFPFLEVKETPENFYFQEKFGTPCQTLRTKFKNNPIWFSPGFRFGTTEQKGLPSTWRKYLKALAFPLGPGAYDIPENCEEDSFVNRRNNIK